VQPAGDLRRVVLRAQAGDHGALDELLRALQGPLYGYLLALLGDGHLAEDALQETLVLIYRKLAWLRDVDLVRPWAFRIATREGWRRLRRERRWRFRSADEEALVDLADPASAPVEEFRPEWRSRLPELLAAVSPASRAVLALHYLEELSLEEAAAVLDLPLGTVKSRLAYGLTQLRRRVAGATSKGEPQ